MRRDTSMESYSLYGAGALRSVLSMKSRTSAMFRAARTALPRKIMSSIPPPRMEVGRVSPITQRSASNRLDLPQPLGPTMAVNPGSMKSSVGSTNDLNPESLSRVTLKTQSVPPRRAASRLLQHGIEIVLQFLPICEDGMNLPIDDESRRAVDAIARIGL